jgi:hypothetical protein
MGPPPQGAATAIEGTFDECESLKISLSALSRKGHGANMRFSELVVDVVFVHRIVETVRRLRVPVLNFIRSRIQGRRNLGLGAVVDRCRLGPTFEKRFFGTEPSESAVLCVQYGDERGVHIRDRRRVIAAVLNTPHQHLAHEPRRWPVSSNVSR